MKILIKGAVQGVFFRSYIKDNADKIRLKGHVRNLQDGKVEVIVQGDKKDVEKMIEICKEGAPHSRVDEVEIEHIKIIDGLKDFKILKF